MDRRAATLPGEYVRHARNIDIEYGGVTQGTVGPVESKLLSFPPLRRWVFGAWGEASEDVHTLVHDLASARLQHMKVLEGRHRWEKRSEAGELAIITGQVRRWLSLEGVRSQADAFWPWSRCSSCCHVQWLGSTGGGINERNAHQLCLAQGHYTLRRGQFLL